MNHIYRLVWDTAKNAIVVASEVTRNRGKAATSNVGISGMRLWRVLGGIALVVAPGVALALPSGGHVVAGQATLHRNGSTLSIHQATPKAILDWKSFGIGKRQTVTFHQPGRSSVALNRVTGSDASAIYGHLNANGQVFLVNPNGVYFAKGAEVNVGGIVASTLGITNKDFLAGKYHFSGNSAAGVVNAGHITATPGGYVAFMGRSVGNQGLIDTPSGTTALGAGGSVDLTLAGDHLLSYHVSAAALRAQAKNGGLIRAPGGRVILTAQAKNALLRTVVNNTGVVQAQTVADVSGTIELLGGHSGTVKVAGTLDASAPHGGNGGNIDTSGQHVQVADHTAITTEAVAGRAGQWTIDPNDFTIAASGGDITGATLSTALQGGNVKIQSTAGAKAGSGDIHVDDTVTWNQHTLTLNAYRNIDIDTAMDGSGTAGLALQYGQGSANGTIDGTPADYHVHAPVNLASTGSFSTQLGSGGSTVHYTIITSLGSQGSTTGTDLQGMNGNTGATYALGANINASATKGWNHGLGFYQIGADMRPFSGVFAGLGHTISGLTIDRPAISQIGLFGYSMYGVIRDVGVVDSHITGYDKVGALVGYSLYAKVSNAYATGAVTGRYFVGGLIGMAGGPDGALIHDDYAADSVNGEHDTGGLVGLDSETPISDSYATGSVTGDGWSGGLVGISSGAPITDVYATGTVSGTNNVGGLVGSNSVGTITDAYATGTVNSHGSSVGGLVGNTSRGGSVIVDSYWDSTTSGQVKGVGSGSSAGTTGLTTTQMQQPDSFAGWNIDTNGSEGTTVPWRIYAGRTEPLLTGLMKPLTVNLNNRSVAYDGSTHNGLGGIQGPYDPAQIAGTATGPGGATNAGTYALDGNQLYSTQQGYDLDVEGSGKLTITPALLTLTGLSAKNKVYDGTAWASATGDLYGIISPDKVTDTLAASFNNKNVGISKPVIVTKITLGGADAKDYTIKPGETTTANITPATLTLGATGASKTYDGTTAADGVVKVAGLQGTDSVSGVQESYQSKDVMGNDGSTLLVDHGYTIHDGNHGHNYTVVTQTAHGTLLPKTITLNGLTVGNRQANGTETGTITNAGTLVGTLPGDSVGVSDSDATATFASSQPGTQTVQVQGLALTGANAHDYTLTGPQTTTATILAPVSTNHGEHSANGAPGKSASGSGTSSDAGVMAALPGIGNHTSRFGGTSAAGRGQPGAGAPGTFSSPFAPGEQGATAPADPPDGGSTYAKGAPASQGSPGLAGPGSTAHSTRGAFGGGDRSDPPTSGPAASGTDARSGSGATGPRASSTSRKDHGDGGWPSNARHHRNDPRTPSAPSTPTAKHRGHSGASGSSGTSGSSSSAGSRTCTYEVRHRGLRAVVRHTCMQHPSHHGAPARLADGG